MRFSVDTGGTFTDLVVEHDDGRFEQFKSPTTPHDPVVGVLDVLARAAEGLGLPLETLLGRGELFIHATTRALNAVLTGTAARTAFLTTEGHPDVLLFREGGRSEVFDHTVPFPAPYVPRALTFEVPERVDVDGRVLLPLDEAAVRRVCGQLREAAVEAVAVCLLWSSVNPVHEERLGTLLADELPGVPVTLSHRLNPALREYRRGSSAAMDASLKPVMGEYLHSLEDRLKAAGFRGRTLMVTSSGDVRDLLDVADAPIHAVGSGPASAPVAARHHAGEDVGAETAIVADTGGTSFDISIVRRGRLPWTREAWVGAPFRGHMTGFPSVDVRSIGAGGGSIASVDAHGLLHVGPESAGSVPGPACYGRGGTRPTVTDASVVLGHLNPDYFLGGAMRLDLEAARRAVDGAVAGPLGLTTEAAAAAILRVTTEHMVRAIEDVTLRQGLDPRDAVLVGGGGAAGLNVVAIGRRLGSPYVIVPRTGATLSAAGALMADLGATFDATLLTSTSAFDLDAFRATIAGLRERCDAFAARAGAAALATTVSYSVEARYRSQVWEIEVPLDAASVDDPAVATELRTAFHATHRDLFGIDDAGSEVEFLNCRARVACRLRETGAHARRSAAANGSAQRPVSMDGGPAVPTTVRPIDSLRLGEDVAGPAIVESPFTTVVVDAGFRAALAVSGSLVIRPDAEPRPPSLALPSVEEAR